MEVKGIIQSILPTETGESASGEWKKVVFVISNNEGYQGKEQIFAFDVFGEEKVDKFLQYNVVGKNVEVSFNIRTNEHNGRYYTSLQAWKIFGLDSAQSSPEPDNDPDDLPF